MNFFWTDTAIHEYIKHWKDPVVRQAIDDLVSLV
jgi:hypothetical protein